MDINEEELIRLDADLDYRIEIGAAVQDPPYHFSRVMELFDVPNRKKILSKAHLAMEKIIPGKYSIEQFVILALYGGFYDGSGYRPNHLSREMLFSDELDASRYDYSIDRGASILYISDRYKEINEKAIKNPDSISFDDLPTHRDEVLVVTTVNCTNPRGLGSVLAGTVFNGWGLWANSIESEVISFFQSALKDSVISDIQAAGLASCAEQLDTIFNSYTRESNLLITDTRHGLNSPRWRNCDTDDIKYKIKYLSDITTIHVPDKHPVIKEAHNQLIQVPELCDRYCLELGEGGFYIPIAQRPLVSHYIREAIIKAERDKATLLSLSPRKFEIFMAGLFEGLGFEVSLSKATRDGGIDLLCLKNHHGIPFSMAVEIKRYTNKPVDVRLIRSFVGSNREYKANRLLFVTTSSYTKPAIEYADQYAGHFLSLASYYEIQQWCADVKAGNPNLF